MRGEMQKAIIETNDSTTVNKNARKAEKILSYGRYPMWIEMRSDNRKRGLMKCD